MKIVFLKDHCENKQGDIVENHPNAEYLIKLLVAEKAKEAKKKKES